MQRGRPSSSEKAETGKATLRDTLREISRKVDGPENPPTGAISTEEAAKLVKVSKRSVERAKKRMKEDPEAHAKAKAGTLPRKRKPKKAPPKPSELRLAPSEPTPAEDQAVVENLESFSRWLHEGFRCYVDQWGSGRALVEAARKHSYDIGSTFLRDDHHFLSEVLEADRKP
jgi:hypothetical protein